MLAGITATKVEATCPATDRPAGAAARMRPPAEPFGSTAAGTSGSSSISAHPSSGLAEFMATAVRCGG